MTGTIGGHITRLFSGQRARVRVAALVLLVVIGVVLVAEQSYRVIKSELTESALARRASVSYLAAAVLSEKFDRLIDIGTALATRVRFRDLIEQGKWTEAVKILSSVPGDFPFIDRIVLADPAGTVIADIPKLSGTLGQNFAHRDWYKGVKRNWQPYVSELYRRTAEPQANVFVVAIPIKSAKDKVLGILDLQVELNTFFDWTRQIDAGPGGFVYIVDQRGKLASHPQFPPQKGLVDYSQLPVVRQVLQGKRGIEIASNPVEGEERVVAYEPVKHGWGVVLSQPSATVFGTRDDQLNRILVAYALILAFLVLAAYFASRIVVQRRQAEIDAQVKAELERRVSERTAQLEISNKELESFSYSVSHDLRAPIRAIDGFAQMLADESGDRLDAEAKRKIAVIRDNSRKMGKLIDALLAFSRLGRQSVATAEVDMAALANEVIEELRAASGNGSVRFVVKPMPGTQCDPALIRQVWVNLLANAVKFTGRAQNPAIEAGGYREGAQNVYYVKDNGAGFDMRYYSKLFGVFQRLHGEGDFPGTGVGLSIVQRVVERHGGRVWAEGKINQGATFYFALSAGPA